MESQTFGHQGDSDQDQKAEGQHLDGRMPIDEVTDRPGRNHHHPDGDDDGQDHDLQVLGQADRGDHRVEGEDDIEQQDLHQHPGKARRHPVARMLLGAFQAVVDLEGALDQQEQAAAEQDQVAPGEGVIQDRKKGPGQGHHPDQGEQQGDAGEHRQGQAEDAGSGPLLLGQAGNQDGDEDDVVDAQDDLQGGKGGQRDPGLGLKNPFHGELPVWLRAGECRRCRPWPQAAGSCASGSSESESLCINAPGFKMAEAAFGPLRYTRLTPCTPCVMLTSSQPACPTGASGFNPQQ